MKTSLVVGMGIGNLYVDVLHKLGHEVVTVDSNPNKNANFETVDAAIVKFGRFDTVHICTPNFTHFDLATKVAKASNMVFIEKPGVSTSNIWETLIKTFPYTRFMMVKNNQWRSNIPELVKLTEKSTSVEIRWHNKDRVPNPGTWFTTKKLAFGGVSRDLMPHLLSLYIALNPDWRKDVKVSSGTKTNWKLEQLTQTDYGIVKADGIYDVDDECHMSFIDKWSLLANWRTNDFDSREIIFTAPTGHIDSFELGLCPEDAYQTMINEAVKHIDDADFWLKQYDIDTWIHEQIESL